MCSSLEEVIAQPRNWKQLFVHRLHNYVAQQVYPFPGMRKVSYDIPISNKYFG